MGCHLAGPNLHDLEPSSWPPLDGDVGRLAVFLASELGLHICGQRIEDRLALNPRGPAATGCLQTCLAGQPSQENSFPHLDVGRRIARSFCQT